MLFAGNGSAIYLDDLLAFTRRGHVRFPGWSLGKGSVAASSVSQ